MKKVTKIIGTSSLIPAFLVITFVFVPMSAKAEVEEIKNPSWQEVPGTKLEGDQNDQYSEPAFVNVNAIKKNGNILTYDLINPDAGYNRVQTNCKTRKFRAIRQGDFQSDTRVNYISQVDPWQKPSSSYHRALIKFVCYL